MPDAPTLPCIDAFYTPQTGSIMYLLSDPVTREAAVIDPVLDFDPSSGQPDYAALDALIARCRARELHCAWILETHAHADRITGADYLRRHLHGRTAAGARIRAVQAHFREAQGPMRALSPLHFDRLLVEGDRILLGHLVLEVMELPGHTPADVGYRVADCVFIGDTLFMPDVGSARCDFPGGHARQLYASIQRLLSLPAATRLFLCHDYPPVARPARWESSVGEQRAHNVHVRAATSEADFVRLRENRDQTLAIPRLMDVALPANLFGQLPF